MSSSSAGSSSTSRVSEILATCREEGRAALVGYLPVGYPSVEISIEAMRVMVDAGVDIVEIGLPYTDPLMDGPIIQTAATKALEAGVRVRDIFTAVEAVSDTGAGALVMTYWNPVLRYGVDRFAADLAAAGGSGLITPDLVPDEAADWMSASDKYDLDRVFLVAPSSTPERLATTTAACRGFVYAASLMGVTGTRDSVGAAAAELAGRVKEVTTTPVCVGLGISTAEQVSEVGSFADGAIVGSALVRTLVEAPDPAAGLHDLSAVAVDLAAGARRVARSVP